MIQYIVEAQLSVDGAPLPSLNLVFDGYHRERGKYYQLGPMTFTAKTSQHINLQVSHTYHFQLRSQVDTEIFHLEYISSNNWMWPQLGKKPLGTRLFKMLRFMSISVYFSGWVDGDSSSQCE